MSSIAPPSHTRRQGVTTDSWITPQWLLSRLGEFDLDPCACDPQPWATANRMLTEKDDGLLHAWHGFIWCNPPYGNALTTWLNRMALHDNGIALVFARTETKAFHSNVWPFASSILFLRGRLTFCKPTGELAPQGHNSGGPSVLIGYGPTASKRLKACSDLGALVILKGAKSKPRHQGNDCLLCGRPFTETEPRPTCHICGKPFTRQTPWRLLRGKRVHNACVPKSLSGDSTSVEPVEPSTRDEITSRKGDRRSMGGKI